MKRLWIGVVLLGILVILGFGTSFGVSQVQRPMEKALQEAGKAALSGRWSEAEVLGRGAKEQWDTWYPFLASVTDHNVLEIIEGQLAELDAWYQKQRAAEYAAACYRIAALTRELADTHSTDWWNLL